MLDALHQADRDARLAALTELDRTLLIEAGAGSGKTSILAGRVTSLLAAGRSPETIAAITFTELASGELRERVSKFVDEVAEGEVRPDLQAAFPEGPSQAQKDALIRARGRLDQLVCTTIHGFCQTLLTPYPVEAAMDPGASILDPGAVQTRFAETLDAWLRERLSGDRKPDDLLVTLYLDNPGRTDALLRLIASRLLRHRRARVSDLEQMDDGLQQLREAVLAFRNFLDQAGCQEEETAIVVAELEALLKLAPGSGSGEAEMLLHLIKLTAPASIAKSDGAYKVYKKLGKWRIAARGKSSVMNAERLHEQAGACYAACQDAHEAAKSYAAARILRILAGELTEVLNQFERDKRSSALIDFDDLLLKTRDLLADRGAVRAALGQRFTAVLVDEFQDTDPLQCEILWRLCGDPISSDQPWTNWTLRPGVLFLVGDPKQAIYRFRDADVACYVDARDRLLKADPRSRLVIGQNFRSVSGILDWVNERFVGPLTVPLQPGFEPLFTRIEALPGQAAVAALPVTVPEGATADVIRDAEAEAVAACCAQIIGTLLVRKSGGGARTCQPDDIVLLAPGGKDLWRYERALEAQGIAVSTQAGKGFYRRQEVQDLIALSRVLADARDTLALGALLRGPLVGLTEEQLLDAVAGLDPVEDGLPRLGLWTPLEQVTNPLLQQVLRILQGLARLARSTTPFVLLCQAVEEFQVRALVRQRQGRVAERALANLDLFLEGARSYDVRGLTAFTTAMRAQWAEAQRAIEGRPDTEQQSVSLVTMHASKGLEWPVVIPINSGSKVVTRMDAAVDREGLLHLPVFGHSSAAAVLAFEFERSELERERHRLWYVATTRARDLLLLPHPSCGAPRSSWMEAFPLRQQDLPVFEVAPPEASHRPEPDPSVNQQDRATFEQEAARIGERVHRVVRITPHLAEAEDGALMDPAMIPLQEEDEPVPAPQPRGSLARGLVLHKLLEEVLTGESPQNDILLERRAAVLAAELDSAPGAASLDPAEAARSVLRGLGLPAIQAIRERLIPECWIANSVRNEEAEYLTSGVADALVLDEDGRVDLVVDWKSDVSPASSTIAGYREQVRSYLRATGARTGLIVFLSSGTVQEIRVDGI